MEKLSKLFSAYKKVMLHSFIFRQLSHFGEEGRKDLTAMLHLLLILLPAEPEQAQPGCWRDCLSQLSSLCFSNAPSGDLLYYSWEKL